jgi:beta-glucosidase
LKLDRVEVDVGGEIKVSFIVTNSGEVRGSEIVQLYAADTATGITLPLQQLVGFSRLELEPGESKTVSFTVPMTLLAYTGLEGEMLMEPGTVELRAGSSSSDIRARTAFSVTGDARVIRGEERAFLSAVTLS